MKIFMSHSLVIFGIYQNVILPDDHESVKLLIAICGFNLCYSAFIHIYPHTHTHTHIHTHVYNLNRRQIKWVYLIIWQLYFENIGLYIYHKIRLNRLNSFFF